MDPFPCERARWRKVLYERQPYPDNYVGAGFLEELRKNDQLTLFSRWEAIFGASAVVQELSSVVLLFVGFVQLRLGTLTAGVLLLESGVSAAAGYLWYRRGRPRLQDLRLAVVFATFGSGLSPLLATLTDSISTDTVYALFAMMMVVHLLTHEFGLDAAPVSRPVSLNAALFAALCLASRLDDPLLVFSFFTLATQLFGLLPSARRHLRLQHGPAALLVLAVLQGAASLLLLRKLSQPAAVFVSAVYVLVCPLAPLLMVRAQRYKDNIYGPWDEAVLDTMELIRLDDLSRSQYHLFTRSGSQD